MVLKTYQTKAIEKISEKISQLLQRPESNSICVFQAPTGSGKTLITALSIDSIMRNNPATDLCFLWVTIGKGDLQIQSRQALERYIGATRRVSQIDKEFTGARRCIERNEIVVANWEKIRSKDAESGSWKSVLMKDGEKRNFREVLEETRNLRKIVLIIDESHYGATAERTTELREEINADVILEMSATPRIQPRPMEIESGSAAYVYVNPQDVIDEGMIKKEIVINEGLNELADSEEDSQTLVLLAAIKKRNELKALFSSEGASINPLVLIQIPNSDAGDLKLSFVVDFLAQQGATEKVGSEGNGKLAVLLSDRRRSDNYPSIADHDSQIDFLVFKQAIDTGWDCPRAHILVKFRESKSETFEIQTVGRILRMPEQHHYASDALNTGYIYTNVSSILVKREEYNPNIIKHLVAKTTRSVAEYGLQSYYRSRADFGDLGATFSDILERVFEEYLKLSTNPLALEVSDKLTDVGISLDCEPTRRKIFSDLGISTTKIDDLEGSIAHDPRLDLILSPDDLAAVFNEFLVRHLGQFTNHKRSLPVFRQSIYVWFRRHTQAKSWSDSTVKIQHVVLNDRNRTHFSLIFESAVSNYADVRAGEVAERIRNSEIHFEYDLPKMTFHNDATEERVELSKYAYTPAYLDIKRSRPERRFETFIDARTDIEWWWKNGESKQEFLGFRYEFPKGMPKTFYPDYLVKTSDGRLLIIEVKDVDDQDGLSVTTAKMRALQAFLASTKSSEHSCSLLAIPREPNPIVADGGNYDWGKTLVNDWSDFQSLEEFLR